MSVPPPIPAPQPNVNVSGRDWRFDFLRVFACVGVVILHTTGQFQESPEYSAARIAAVLLHDVARTAVPLFFMLAGSLAAPTIHTRGDVVQFWRKRSRRLWFPTLVWSGIYLLLYLVNEIAGSAEIPVSALVSDWILKGKPGAGYHLWFLYVLIVLELAAPWAELFRRRSALSRRLTDAALCLILASFGVYTILAVSHGGDGRSALPFPVLASGYLPWYLLGARLREHAERTPAESKRAAAFCALLAAVAGVGSAAAVTYTLGYGYGRSDFLPPGVLAAVGVWVFVLLCPAEPGARIRALLRAAAGLSMGIYLVHVAVLALVSRLPVFPESPDSRDNLLCSLLCAAATLFVSGAIVALMKRLPLLKRLV